MNGRHWAGRQPGRQVEPQESAGKPKRGQAPHLSLPPGRSTAIGAGLAHAYEPSSAGKTNPATSWFQEDLHALTLLGCRNHLTNNNYKILISSSHAPAWKQACPDEGGILTLRRHKTLAAGATPLAFPRRSLGTSQDCRVGCAHRSGFQSPAARHRCGSRPASCLLCPLCHAGTEQVSLGRSAGAHHILHPVLPSMAPIHGSWDSGNPCRNDEVGADSFTIVSEIHA